MMTELCATTPITDLMLRCCVLVRAASIAEMVGSSHVADELLNAMEAKP